MSAFLRRFAALPNARTRKKHFPGHRHKLSLADFLAPILPQSTLWRFSANTELFQAT
jgi:hypothetical protein